MTTNSIAMQHFIATTNQETRQPPSVQFTIAQSHSVMQFHVAAALPAARGRPPRSMRSSKPDAWCPQPASCGDRW